VLLCAPQSGCHQDISNTCFLPGMPGLSPLGIERLLERCIVQSLLHPPLYKLWSQPGPTLMISLWISWGRLVHSLGSSYAQVSPLHRCNTVFGLFPLVPMTKCLPINFVVERFLGIDLSIGPSPETQWVVLWGGVLISQRHSLPSSQLLELDLRSLSVDNSCCVASSKCALPSSWSKLPP